MLSFNPDFFPTMMEGIPFYEQNCENSFINDFIINILNDKSQLY